MRHRKLLLWGISIIFVVIPFLWLAPGEMNLGGDSSRLYFYDPVNYLKSFPLYGSLLDTIAVSTVSYYLIPFIVFLVMCKQIIQSPYLIITLFNSVSLVIAFLSIYAVTVELLKCEDDKDKQSIVYISAILAGLFYIFSPLLTTRWSWDRVLFVQYDFFLNPLFFLFFLKYIHTNKIIYLLSLLPITLVFAPNFSPTPNFFSFFPIATFYLFIYTSLIKKTKVDVKKIFVVLFLFLIMHLFRIVPEAISFFTDPNNIFRYNALDEGGKLSRGLGFFLAHAAGVKLANNLISFPYTDPNIIEVLTPLLFFYPLIPIGGLFLSVQKKDATEQRVIFLLSFVFFLIMLFFMTANITNLGFNFYKNLFHIPGFAMFRGFAAKFANAYAFFYAILIGYSIFFLLFRMSKRYRLAFSLVVAAIITVISFPFIRGDMIRIALNKGQPVEYAIPAKMDPAYEKFLEYIRNDQVDGRFFSLPYNENYMPMVAGTQGGMYQGPSMIAYLTGRTDLSGYQTMIPFSETFIRLATAKDYQTIENLFSLLNIKFIFYNSDEQIYAYFPDFPYQYVREFLPPDKESNTEFIKNLKVAEKKNFGNKYYLYQVDNSIYLPHIYVARKVSRYDWKEYFFVEDDGRTYGSRSNAFYKASPDYERRTVFFEQGEGEKIPDVSGEKIPTIVITKVNPTRYRIQVKNAQEPYVLAFANPFNPNWQLFLSEKEERLGSIVSSYYKGEIQETEPLDSFLDKDTFRTWARKTIAQNAHIRANAYANAWFIRPEDVGNKLNYTLILDFAIQKWFYITSIISLMGLFICIACFVLLVVPELKRKKEIV